MGWDGIGDGSVVNGIPLSLSLSLTHKHPGKLLKFRIGGGRRRDRLMEF